MPSFEHHYRRLFPILRAKCVRLLGSGAEAEEVAQETFLRLWKAGKTEDPPRELLAWAHTTATRMAIDRLRHRRVRSAHREPAGHSHQAHVGLILDELTRDTPRDQLTAVLLHRVDGMPQAAVAASLGCTDRTVRRWITDFDARHAEAS